MAREIIWRKTIPILMGTAIALYLAGCATGPADEEKGYLFYPSLPNPPYIQYLATFSNENDVKGGVGSFGKFILGGEANIPGVEKPYGTALYDGKIYVVDARGGGYAIFDLKAQDFRFVRGSGGGVMKKPINIVIDSDGSKYITDTLRQQVLVYDREDNYLQAFGEEGELKPSGVAVAGDRLFVSNLLKQNIHVLDKRSGELLFKFPPEGAKDPEHIGHPTNLTVSDGHIFVTDTTGAKVVKFTTSGEYVTTIGRMGTNIGEFARPKGLAVDRAGNLYVADAAFENVQIFTEEGKLLLFFGGPGYERENINLPTAVAVDYDNVEYFRQYAAPDFNLEYVILVASQFGVSKVNVYGFGKMANMDYSTPESL
ncbi:MAG: 6-bladed beta-propeller [Candidatus Thiodiazotropha sp. (ex Dulcina madagascariensis)]|nr:6-bladed beta-propeller [Candidatus Thiodiazotropha sp. (ex Dulcina madagascariensis)]MCU7936995.1 6-bladed beta-propeller [Candidatus Thiodiazotropha sp. (ex Dulcina madagascariensis)]